MSCLDELIELAKNGGDVGIGQSAAEALMLGWRPNIGGPLLSYQHSRLSLDDDI